MREKLPEWIESINTATDAHQLDALKATLLGKAGLVTSALKSLGQLPADERKAAGAEINSYRDTLLSAFSARMHVLLEAEVAKKLKEEAIDVTLSAHSTPLGLIHPLTTLLEEIKDFFYKRGFEFAEGPEIDDEWHNFDALNLPGHHPARQNHDTFYIDPAVGSIADNAAHAQDSTQEPHANTNRSLLRTHTSTIQIRALAKKKPPLRLISYGRVYRSDDLDATHTPMFHQIEGLVLDKNIHMGHLKGLIREFCSTLFSTPNAPIRFRPSFFPFTEPSAEVDIACCRKDGKLVMGEGGDWLELLGCGMMHPNVLRNCGVDPEAYQGFAFGIGLERLCMLKHGIIDIRQLYEGDEHWMKHFGTFGL